MSKEGEEQIMISYHLESVEAVKVIKESLEERGYCIRMELRHGEGGNARAMTEIVDNSSAVLLCVTKAYKDSLNCNREASYADSRRKIIIPLKLDRNIELDGWLESIVGGKRCYEFYDSKSVKETVSELDKELISLGVQKNRDISSANIGQPLDTLRVDEVCSWLKGIEIDSAIIETFRENCVSGDDLTQITYEELIGEDFELLPLDAGKIIKKRDACFNATQSNAVTPDGRSLRAGTGRAGASKGKSAQDEAVGGPFQSLPMKKSKRREEVSEEKLQYPSRSGGASQSKLKKMRDNIFANMCGQNIAFFGQKGHGKSATINTFYQALMGTDVDLTRTSSSTATAETGKYSRHVVDCKEKHLYFCEIPAFEGDYHYQGSLGRCRDVLSGKGDYGKSFSRRSLEWIGFFSDETWVHCIVFIEIIEQYNYNGAILSASLSEARRMYGNGIPMIIVGTCMDKVSRADIKTQRERLVACSDIDAHYVYPLANYCALQKLEHKTYNVSTDEDVLTILDVIVKAAKIFKNGGIAEI